MAVITTQFDVSGGQLYCRHNTLDPSRETLLFIHGLGESGLCFLEALQHPFFRKYNILIPDLIGFGRSAAAETDDYSFDSQIDRLATLLDETNTDRVHIIGHSMGGDLGTLFCGKYSARTVSFVNVEGDLTPDDRFITNKVIEADRDGRFVQWLRDDFARGIVVNWAESWPSCVRYLASLQLCAPSAFLTSAQQIYDLNAAAPNRDGGIIGVQYLRLSLTKVFCSGSESLSSGSKAFLTNNNLLHRPFPKTFHWVMLDAPQAFYGFLADFIAQNRYAA
jgi:pimeloyl-ACP methyl ester carboxylesterase